ncbi:MAG: sulfur relay protein DsrH [Anaerolineae bacterium]|nr:sulfur relay protein DsrH [Anaerolineae bacterium]
MALVLIKYGVHHPIERVKIECAEENDSLVLLQDGVFWVGTDEIDETKADVYALQLDFCARGYPEEGAAVPLISYPELVDLIVKEEKAIT